MKAICLKCHTNPRILQFYTEAEGVVSSTNKMVNEAKGIVDELAQGQAADGRAVRRADRVPLFRPLALLRPDGQARRLHGRGRLRPVARLLRAGLEAGRAEEVGRRDRKDEQARRRPPRRRERRATETGRRSPCDVRWPARPWWADPLLWVELFVAANIAFLAVDIGLAHAVNAFEHPAEWVPVVFSLAATLVLLAGDRRSAAWTRVGPGRSTSRPRVWRRTALPWHRACWSAGARSRSASPACSGT